MTTAIDPVSQVVARIDRIERRFAPAQATQQQSVVQTGQFDPFGELYQAALETRTSTSTGSYGTASSSAYGYATALTSAHHDHGSGVGQIGGYGKIEVPAVLEQYGNGRIPAGLLTPIRQSGHELFAPAAVSWDRLVDAARADGIEMTITDSYRSYEEQVDLAQRKGLYQNGGLAAVPGTSNHGWGLAVDADVTDAKALEWMRANAPRFGFVEAVPREPWHWEYRPHQV